MEPTHLRPRLRRCPPAIGSSTSTAPVSTADTTSTSPMVAAASAPGPATSSGRPSGQPSYAVSTC